MVRQANLKVESQGNVDSLPSNNQTIVDDFVKEYQRAWMDVEKAKETTDTEAWQSLYANHIRDITKRRIAIAEKLTELAEVMKASGWDEELEKAAKDEVKNAVEMGESELQWRVQVVSPLCSSVEFADRLVDDIRKKVAQESIARPMFNAQLTSQLEAELQALPIARFNEQTGVIEVERFH